MKDKIIKSIDSPSELEALYRSNKSEFKKAFFAVYDEIADKAAAQFWKERLEPSSAPAKPSWLADIAFFLAVSLAVFVVIKLPFWLDYNYTAPLSFAARFYVLAETAGIIAMLMFIRRDKSTVNIIAAALIVLFSAIYMALLPDPYVSDSIGLVYIHYPLLLWCCFGLVFVRFKVFDVMGRVAYLRYFAQLVVVSSIILFISMVFTGLIMALFYSIDVKADRFFLDYVFPFEFVAGILISLFLIEIFPGLVEKIVSVVARIMSIVVSLGLFFFLLAFFFAGDFTDLGRDNILTFNILLLGVVAIVIFSVLDLEDKDRRSFFSWALFVLSVLAVIVNLVALVAIVSRTVQMQSLTPNRLVLIGTNIVILGNLLLFSVDFVRLLFLKGSVEDVKRRIGQYLPAYAGWAVFGSFFLPLFF